MSERTTAWRRNVAATIAISGAAMSSWVSDNDPNGSLLDVLTVGLVCAGAGIVLALLVAPRKAPMERSEQSLRRLGGALAFVGALNAAAFWILRHDPYKALAKLIAFTLGGYLLYRFAPRLGMRVPAMRL